MGPVRPLVLISVLLGACGGAAPATQPTAACPDEESALSSAQAALESCQSEGGDVSEDEAAYVALAERLREHEASLTTTPTVTDASAMAVADLFWAYLDRVASRFTDHGPLARAEDAAEALMRDRTGDEAVEAAAGARAALETLHALVAPESAPAPERCAEEVEMVREATEDLERSCPHPT
jgi:hypothetical protein